MIGLNARFRRGRDEIDRIAARLHLPLAGDELGEGSRRLKRPLP
jgi:hypothetical protein